MGRNKLRLGIREKGKADAFVEGALVQLAARGFRMKNERTWEFIGEEDGGSGGDTASETSSASEGGVRESLIAYDVPGWMTPAQVTAVLSPTLGTVYITRCT